jgi:putative ATP-binding cassette transporter
MKLLELFQKESTTSPHKLVLMAAIAGISNAAVLGIINAAAAQAAQQTPDFRYVLYFGLAVALYVTAQSFVMLATSREVETVLHNVRLRIAKQIVLGDLLTIEKIGRSQIYASITKETLTISNIAPVLSVGVQAGMLLFFASLYIAYLSLTAFVVSAIFVAIAVSIHFRRREQLQQSLHAATDSENTLFDSLTDILDGFKEVKISTARGADLLSDVGHISRSTADLKIKTQGDMARYFVFSQTVFLMLLATIVFVVPRLSPSHGEAVIPLTAAILFLIGPISSLVGTIPALAQANTAAENIYALESALSQHPDQGNKQGIEVSGFERIVFDNVIFRYTDAAGAPSFVIGPLNLEIRAQEVLFVVGGNGSGKSTFLKLLTGLYYPESGQIRVDGAPLEHLNIDRYRGLFSVIFSDYHLFKKLYGFASVDHQRLEGLLRAMEIEHKTRLIDNEFKTLELSHGQKKRLALLVSLLEDKPVYVFDEWAADQDPSFRRKFYEQLLKELKQKRKTIIAVTHDDKYFGVADRRMKMEEGRFVEIEATVG